MATANPFLKKSTSSKNFLNAVLNETASSTNISPPPQSQPKTHLQNTPHQVSEFSTIQDKKTGIQLQKTEIQFDQENKKEDLKERKRQLNVVKVKLIMSSKSLTAEQSTIGISFEKTPEHINDTFEITNVSIHPKLKKHYEQDKQKIMFQLYPKHQSQITPKELGSRQWMAYYFFESCPMNINTYQNLKPVQLKEQWKSALMKKIQLVLMTSPEASNKENLCLEIVFLLEMLQMCDRSQWEKCFPGFLALLNQICPPLMLYYLREKSRPSFMLGHSFNFLNRILSNKKQIENYENMACAINQTRVHPFCQIKEIFNYVQMFLNYYLNNEISDINYLEGKLTMKGFYGYTQINKILYFLLQLQKSFQDELKEKENKFRKFLNSVIRKVLEKSKNKEDFRQNLQFVNSQYSKLKLLSQGEFCEWIDFMLKSVLEQKQFDDLQSFIKTQVRLMWKNYIQTLQNSSNKTNLLINFSLLKYEQNIPLEVITGYLNQMKQILSKKELIDEDKQIFKYLLAITSHYFSSNLKQYCNLNIKEEQFLLPVMNVCRLNKDPEIIVQCCKFIMNMTKISYIQSGKSKNYKIKGEPVFVCYSYFERMTASLSEKEETIINQFMNCLYQHNQHNNMRVILQFLDFCQSYDRFLWMKAKDNPYPLFQYIHKFVKKRQNLTEKDVQISMYLAKSCLEDNKYVVLQKNIVQIAVNCFTFTLQHDQKPASLNFLSLAVLLITELPSQIPLQILQLLYSYSCENESEKINKEKSQKINIFCTYFILKCLSVSTSQENVTIMLLKVLAWLLKSVVSGWQEEYNEIKFNHEGFYKLLVKTIQCILPIQTKYSIPFLDQNPDRYLFRQKEITECLQSIKKQISYIEDKGFSQNLAYVYSSFSLEEDISQLPEEWKYHYYSSMNIDLIENIMMIREISVNKYAEIKLKFISDLISSIKYETNYGKTKNKAKLMYLLYSFVKETDKSNQTSVLCHQGIMEEQLQNFVLVACPSNIHEFSWFYRIIALFILYIRNRISIKTIKTILKSICIEEMLNQNEGISGLLCVEAIFKLAIQIHVQYQSFSSEDKSYKNFIQGLENMTQIFISKLKKTVICLRELKLEKEMDQKQMMKEITVWEYMQTLIKIKCIQSIVNYCQHNFLFLSEKRSKQILFNSIIPFFSDFVEKIHPNMPLVWDNFSKTIRAYSKDYRVSIERAYSNKIIADLLNTSFNDQVEKVKEILLCLGATLPEVLEGEGKMYGSALMKNRSIRMI